MTNSQNSKILKLMTLPVVYMLGANLYFALWYLGAGREVKVWSFQHLDFFSQWLVVNVASMGSIVIFTLLRTRLSGLLPKRSIGQWLFLLSCILQTALFIGLYVASSLVVFGLDEYHSIISYLNHSNFFSLLLFQVAVIGSTTVLANLQSRFGQPGRLLKHLLFGRIRPTQENRGFIFIDLNGSTALAERISHDLYSNLIHDCFQELEQVIDTFQGLEVYQYVGDEAILSWKLNGCDIRYQAIEVFLRFKKRLLLKKAYFCRNYDHFPTFKCAIHCGVVTRSDLGQSVVQTAFHGDVVNTASRILGLCHTHRTDLLLSKDYYQLISEKMSADKFEKEEGIWLNGKEHRITLYKYNPLLVSKNSKSITNQTD